MSEKVICFRADLLEEHSDDGPVFFSDELLEEILAGLEPLPREEAEENPLFKQIVVYALIKSQGRFLSYRRTPLSTEGRLRSKYSIGIGGHVNAADERQPTFFEDDPAEGFLAGAMWREVNEEVRLESEVVCRPRMLCFINDDSSGVGRVHFGIAWVIETRKPEVSSRKEKGIGSLAFHGVEELIRKKERFENWSKLLIERTLGGDGRVRYPA